MAENENVTIVQETGKGKFNQEIKVGKHVLVGDEPVANGGNDLGPSPYDFLLAALGTCTSMTVRYYADFKKIPLSKVSVSLTHEKKYAQDCADCEKSDAKIDHIERKITLEGDLSEEQRKKLLEVANKCPVHKTLTSTVKISTELL